MGSVGVHYDLESNVKQAKLLPAHCKLLLTVGLLDTNVDPSSTFQVVNALIEANKDFDLCVFPKGRNKICPIFTI